VANVNGFAIWRQKLLSRMNLMNSHLWTEFLLRQCRTNAPLVHFLLSLLNKKRKINKDFLKSIYIKRNHRQKPFRSGSKQQLESEKTRPSGSTSPLTVICQFLRHHRKNKSTNLITEVEEERNSTLITSTKGKWPRHQDPLRLN
jgi:hypothetical protein